MRLRVYVSKYTDKVMTPLPSRENRIYQPLVKMKTMFSTRSNDDYQFSLHKWGKYGQRQTSKTLFS